jgi:hypothetical protein
LPTIWLNLAPRAPSRRVDCRHMEQGTHSTPCSPSDYRASVPLCTLRVSMAHQRVRARPRISFETEDQALHCRALSQNFILQLEFWLADPRPFLWQTIRVICRHLIYAFVCILMACNSESSSGHIRQIATGSTSMSQRDGSFKRLEKIEFVLPKGFNINDPSNASIVDSAGRSFRASAVSLQSSNEEQMFTGTFEVAEHSEIVTLRVDSFIVDLRHSRIIHAAGE